MYHQGFALGALAASLLSADQLALELGPSAEHREHESANQKFWYIAFVGKQTFL